MRKKTIEKFIERSHSFRQILITSIVTVVHVFFLLATGANVTGDPTAKTSEHLIKLSDIIEVAPPEEEPPPDLPPQQEEAVDPLADTMIETDQKVEQVALATSTSGDSASQGSQEESGEEEFLPQFAVQQVPIFDQRSIIPIYPPIALRTGIEGIVFLELFIDKQGYVRKIVVLKETPPDKGFGEAAVAAFEGKKCRPAEAANGESVAVRYRYPVRFAIR